MRTELQISASAFRGAFRALGKLDRKFFDANGHGLPDAEILSALDLAEACAVRGLKRLHEIRLRLEERSVKT